MERAAEEGGEMHILDCEFDLSITSFCALPNMATAGEKTANTKQQAHQSDESPRSKSLLQESESLQDTATSINGVSREPSQTSLSQSDTSP